MLRAAGGDDILKKMDVASLDRNVANCCHCYWRGWHVPELAKGVETAKSRPSQAQGRATRMLTVGDMTIKADVAVEHSLVLR